MIPKSLFSLIEEYYFVFVFAVSSQVCFGIFRLKFHLATFNESFNLYGYIGTSPIPPYATTSSVFILE